MTHTVNDQRLIFKNLWDNCLKVMVSYFPPNERVPFYSYSSTALIFGLAYGLENACITNMGHFLRHIVGEESKTDIPSDVSREMTHEPSGSLSVFHNHPNSTAPSCDDYKFFLTRMSVKNMAVCGHRGNLYFMQKGKLFYQETDEMIERICVELCETLGMIALRVFEFYGYTLDEMHTVDYRIKAVCFDSVMEVFFVYTCRILKKYGFQSYRKG